MTTTEMKISDIKPNPNNPRLIKDEKFKRLVESVKKFPEMLRLRPIVVNEANVIIGGNMRWKAAKEAGYKTVPVTKAVGLTEEQEREFIIKDNVGFGEWDWEMLANEWESEKLEEWGLDVDNVSDDKYTSKIVSPIYEPSMYVPDISELYNTEKRDELLHEIENSNINKDVKRFLYEAANRHVVINFSKVADYYSNSDENVKHLFERSGLVILDFDKAIEYGYVQLTKEIQELRAAEHGD